MSNSTAWSKSNAIARWVGIALVIILAVATTAWALHAQVINNTADIRSLKDKQSDIDRKVNDLWIRLLDEKHRTPKKR